MSLRALPLVLCLSAGCGTESRRISDGDSDSDTDSEYVDQTAPLFERDRVLEIEIDMDPDDWDALRTQTRSLEDTLFGRDCLDDPFGSPFTWFHATVTVDGETVDDCGVRKKGFLGSLSETKPSLKISIDEFQDQTLLFEDDFVLNNSLQDPSFVHQCLAYDTFAAGGAPAPRCNFARVTVNGEDLGAYVHVERVDKDFLAREIGSNDGNLYEGTLSDFRDEWMGTFEKKTNESDPDRSDLEAVVAALDVPDSELEASLGGVVDLDGFLTFWATEVLVAHGDGYTGNTNNFFVYHDPTSDLFHFVPWGADSTMNAGPPEGIDSVMAQGVLPWRLYRYGPTQSDYVDRMRRVLDVAWDEGAIQDEIDRMQDLVSPLLRAGEDVPFELGLATVRDFVENRRAAIEDELGMPPPWDAPLRDSFCFVTVGTGSGTFESTFGTFDADPFTSGSGTLDVTVDAASWEPTSIGGQADYDPDDPGRLGINVFAPLPDGTIGIVALRFVPAAFAPGGPIPFDFATASGIIAIYSPVPEAFEIVGIFMNGTVTLDEASTVEGAPVSGSFTAEIVEWPF